MSKDVLDERMGEDLLTNNATPRSARSLPLVRLNSAAPFVAELDRRGLSADDVLDSVGLSRAALNDSETFVHALVLYQFLEAAAEAAGERHLGASIGEQLDLTKRYPTIGFAESALTAGDLLTAWVVTATKHSTAIEQRLEIRGATAILSGYRSFKLSLLPAQVDGFHAGFLISILRHAMGADWNPTKVLVTVSDPKALPPIFHGISSLKGNRRGHKIQFPATWLTRHFDRTDFLQRALLETERHSPSKRSSHRSSRPSAPMSGGPTCRVQKLPRYAE